MTTVHQQSLQSLFSTEHECVVYLFKNRWPNGFICPFCRHLQQDIAPAYSVVCRYCRKQTSITAHTVMHGSKNSLLSWMRIAWQFCRLESGISAREIQRRMELPSYQTAWRWLHKLRLAAGLAESAPYSGKVLFADQPLRLPHGKNDQSLAMFLQLDSSDSSGYEVQKIRFVILDQPTMQQKTTFISRFISEGSTVLIQNSRDYQPQLTYCLFLEADKKHVTLSMETAQNAIDWLSTVYRKNPDGEYLQAYLNEFSFRFNTAGWKNQLLIFQHLISGILTPCPTPRFSPMKHPQDDSLPLFSRGSL